MKKLILILTFVVVAMAVNAQGRGRVGTLTVDTLQGNENVTFSPISLTGGYGSLFISAKIERISTAAGGTFYLKTGIDANSALVVNQSTNPRLSAAPNDTLATTDVATQYWNLEIQDPGALKYYIFGDGDANDTVKVTIRYVYK